MFFSIRFKIFIVIAAFFTIVISANMFYDLNKSKKQLTQYLENLNKSSAKLLHENVKSSFYNLDYTRTKNTINTFDNEYFKNIYILNKDGYIFAQRNVDEIFYEKFKDFDKLLKLDDKNKFLYFQPISITRKVIGYLVIENNNEIFEQINKEKKREILQIFTMLLIITILVSTIISIIITKPIFNIINSIKSLNQNKTFGFEHNDDEFGYLSREIEQNHKKIHDLNNTLEQRVYEEVEKNKQKDKLLQKQNLRASMGEMMDAIAHQWLQPLNVISLNTQELDLKLELGNIEDSDILDSCKNTQMQITHLSNTLNEFRSFFRSNKKTEDVLLKDLIETTLDLLKDEIISNKIIITIECSQEERVNIIPNEFKHILINLIGNAKDAFIENNIEDRKINIEIFDVNNKVIVNIQDNAGGIPKDIINRIFNANVTSKEEDKGTGIGLYMSKMIIEKIGGTIEVENIDGGACFTISLNT